MLGPHSSMIVRRVAATLVFSSLVLGSMPAFAAGDEMDERRMQAQVLYDQGTKLEASDPKAALAAYRSSYEIHASHRVLYNIGRLCLRTGDKECAVRSFEQYLKDGGSEVPAKRRREVEAELKTLSKAATTLTIKSSVSGAFVKIDGTVVGRTPLAQPVRVSAGHHKVVLVADGNVVEKSVQVAAGSSETVELEMKKQEEEPAPPPAPAAAPDPEPETKPPASPTPPPEPARPSAAETKQGVPVLPWIIAGAFATGTVVTGILTAGASSDYERLQGQYPVSRDSLDEAHGKGRDLLLVTTALGAATVVSLGVASYFTFFRGSGPTHEKTIGVAVGPGGVGITGRLP